MTDWKGERQTLAQSLAINLVSMMIIMQTYLLTVSIARNPALRNNIMTL